MSCRFDYEFDMLCTVGGGEPLACLALLHSLPEALAFRGCYCAEILSKSLINNPVTWRHRIAIYLFLSYY